MNTTTSNQNGSINNKASVLWLDIKEKASLHLAYMPFIDRGGIFIPTSKPYKIGDEIFMLLNLLDDPVKSNLAGKVVWVNPVAQAGKPQGIGVQFNNDANGLALKNKIEVLLGGLISSNRPTHTI
ncbi:MAG: PilZ domain-containing protein [Candidatus Methylopumilus sp.]